MKGIDVVRVRYLLHLMERLDRRGGRSSRYLAKAGVPERLLENPDAIITAHSLMSFLGQAIRDTGWHLLGYEAGGTPLEDHGVVGKAIVRAPTLYQAARRLMLGSRRETSITDDFMTFEGGLAWLCKTPLLGTREQKEQVELYNLHILLQMVRRALGPDWMPPRVRVRCAREAVFEAHPTLRRLPVEFGASATGVAVPLEALARPLPQPAEAEGDEEALLVESRLQDGMLTLDSMNALRRILETYLPWHPTLESLSRLTGISKRTLQRFLQSRGSSFSRLLEQVAFSRAIELLADPEVRIREIARALGYSDAAHFSRAFRRMAGLSPTAYRKKALGLCDGTPPDPDGVRLRPQPARKERKIR